MNIKELDRIEITIEEFLRLLQWRDNHKEYVYDYKQVLPEGIIDVKGGMSVYFKFEDAVYTYYEAFTDNTTVIKLKTRRFPMNYQVVDMWYDEELIRAFKGIDPKYVIEDLVADVCTTVASTMAYLEHFKSEVVEKEVDIPRTKTQRKRAEWHNRNNPNKVVKLKKTVFSIKNGTRYVKTEEEKREYQRLTQSWSVRGHWRTLKSGKRVWVNAHEKGQGKKNPRIYKLEG